MLRDKRQVWLYGRTDAIDRCFAKCMFVNIWGQRGLTLIKKNRRKALIPPHK